ncbi:hypothetical protein [Brucella pseudintermedia]|uniref:hypothetical protein n=1 Tax=Brucella pseudintermedia TaxID=370111 RepID=UPI00124C0089|nr:hypothetical protein [Brucella pseudintermedia]KAB2680969.1 hypothetical protein F9K78_15305 [Brucella pseudintermedia]
MSGFAGESIAPRPSMPILPARVPARAFSGSRVVEDVISLSLDGRSELTLHFDGAEFVAEFKVQP